MKKILLSTSLLLLTSLSLWAGGYRVALQGTRQAGMGHTSTSFRQDASNMFFNPASISFADYKAGISLNFFGINSNSYYQNPSTLENYETDNPMSTPFQLGGYYTLSNGVTFALNVCTPFGSTVEWPAGWTGSDLVNTISLSAIYIQPTIAYQIAEDLSIGASFNIVTGNINLQRSISSVGGDMELDGQANGLGYTVGIYGKIDDKFRYGLSYRSCTEMKAENQRASFNLPSSIVDAVNGPFFTEQDNFSASLPMVSEWTTGVSYRFADKFTLSGEFNLAQWKQYKSLDIDFEQNEVGNDLDDATLSSTPKNFRNTGTIRVGGEFAVSETVDIRGGYYYDPSPVKSEYWSPETPSVDIHAGTFGLGFHFGQFDIDMAALAFSGSERYFDNTYQNFSGDTKGDAMAFGVGLTYNFSKKIKPTNDEEL